MGLALIRIRMMFPMLWRLHSKAVHDTGCMLVENGHIKGKGDLGSLRRGALCETLYLGALSIMG